MSGFFCVQSLELSNILSSKTYNRCYISRFSGEKLMMFEPPNLKPPSKFDKLLDKIAVPILSVVIGSVLGAWLFGKILIVDFNWVMLGLGMVTTSIVAYYVIYSIRTKKNFEKYIVSLKDEHDKQIT